MNRFDEIQGCARDIASNVHADPVLRDAMADDLIKLIGLMINAMGKAVAIEGESKMNEVADWEFELDSMSIEYSSEEEAEKLAEFEAEQQRDTVKYHGMYLAGEEIQDAARELVKDATNPKVRLERWREITPGTGCRCGHVPSVHQDGPCTGEQYNGAACEGGPCLAFVVREPEGGWVHEDRRPKTLRNLCDPGTLVMPELIRSEVRDEMRKAAEKDALTQKLATQDRWNSDQFLQEVARLRDGRPTMVVSPDELRQCDNCMKVTVLEGLCTSCGQGTAVHPVQIVDGGHPDPFRTDVRNSAHCNCCAGTCRNGAAVTDPAKCCYPLGDVCPTHC